MNPYPAEPSSYVLFSFPRSASFVSSVENDRLYGLIDKRRRRLRLRAAVTGCDSESFSSSTATETSCLARFGTPYSTNVLVR